VQILDTSGDGLISFEEFVDWWVNKVRAPARRRPRLRVSLRVATKGTPCSVTSCAKAPACLHPCGVNFLRKGFWMPAWRGKVCVPPCVARPASPATHPLRKRRPDARELARAQVDPSKMQTKS